MKNEELLCRHGSRLNPFTTALRDACLAHGQVLVRMRGGDWCDVVYVPPEGDDVSEHPYDDCPHGGFRSQESSRYWLANGESITGDRFDLVEFKPTAGELTEKAPDNVAASVSNAAMHIAAHWHEHIPAGNGVPFHHHPFIEQAIREAGAEFVTALKSS